ncbi:MAG: ribulose-phosphate 3-epimerase [Thermosulfidibacteraceae bacterium]
MVKIAPSILSADLWKLGEEIRKVERGGAHLLHVDVMDGHFVPNISIGFPVIESIKGKTKLPLDVHLMIERPESYVERFVEAGADIVTFHIEATYHPNRVIQILRKYEVKVGVSLNPTTPLDSLHYVLEDVDIVLVMSVNPGFGGQKFISFVLDKIRDLRRLIDSRSLKVEIEVDGGINLLNVRSVVEAGADIIVAGSSIFKADNPEERVKEFLRVVDSLT